MLKRLIYHSHTMFALVALTIGSARALSAQPTTQVMVRVTSSDAKIIGSGVGGANVTIRDATTGEVLASGRQNGGTGDTGLIMGTRERGVSVYDTEGAAGFLAEIAIDEPTWIEIEVTGPLGTPQALRRASQTMLLVPGQHVLGDGVVLEMFGFTVELTGPAADVLLPAGTTIEVSARVTMLCGCPTSPGGTWDSDRYTIVARELRDGIVMQEVAMSYAGTTSTYTGALAPMDLGPVVIEVLAMDAGRANFGAARAHYVVGH